MSQDDDVNVRNIEEEIKRQNHLQSLCHSKKREKKIDRLKKKKFKLVNGPTPKKK